MTPREIKLSDLAAELGQETDDGVDVAADTRRRIMQTLQRRKDRVRKIRAFFLMGGLGLMGTTAFAWYGGGVSEWFEEPEEAVEVALGETVEDPGGDGAEGRGGAGTQTEADADAEAETEAETEADAEAEAETEAETEAEAEAETEVEAVADVDTMTEANTRRGTVAPVAEPPLAAEAEREPGGVNPLYRAAHDLHVGGGSPNEVLSAWDAYLAQASSGPLVQDARYNRALTLVRLGRRAEARLALSRFADAGEGSFRFEEATQLLEHLR